MSSKVIWVRTADIKLKQTRFARRRVYTVSALKLGFHWDFTIQTPVILLKNIFEFMFNMARSTLYRQHWWKLQGKGFNNIFSTSPLVCSTWPRGNESRPGAPKVPSLNPPTKTFSLRFFAFFFLFLFVQFSFQLLQFFYVSLYSLRFLDL